MNWCDLNVYCRLPQADLTRLLFGSIELELLLLQPGVQLTCFDSSGQEGMQQDEERDQARRPNHALMVLVLQALLGGDARCHAHVWWSDQI